MDAQNVNRLDFEVGMFELYSRIQLMSRLSRLAKLTRLMTQLRAQDASAPGKMYLFMLKGRISNHRQRTSSRNPQETPVQVLKLPTSSDTGNLHDEDSVIVQEIVNLLQESAVSSNADMLKGKFNQGTALNGESLTSAISRETILLNVPLG